MRALYLITLILCCCSLQNNSNNNSGSAALEIEAAKSSENANYDSLIRLPGVSYAEISFQNIRRYTLQYQNRNLYHRNFLNPLFKAMGLEIEYMLWNTEFQFMRFET